MASSTLVGGGFQLPGSAGVNGAFPPDNFSGSIPKMSVNVLLILRHFRRDVFLFDGDTTPLCLLYPVDGNGLNDFWTSTLQELRERSRITCRSERDLFLVVWLSYVPHWPWFKLRERNLAVSLRVKFFSIHNLDVTEYNGCSIDASALARS